MTIKVAAISASVRVRHLQVAQGQTIRLDWVGSLIVSSLCGRMSLTQQQGYTGRREKGCDRTNIVITQDGEKRVALLYGALFGGCHNIVSLTDRRSGVKD